MITLIEILSISYFHCMSQNKLCLVCDHWKQSIYSLSCVLLNFVVCFQMLKVAVQTTFSCTFLDQNSTLVPQIWILTQGKNHNTLLYSCNFFKDSPLFLLNSNLFSCDLFKDTPTFVFF